MSLVSRESNDKYAKRTVKAAPIVQCGNCDAAAAIEYCTQCATELCDKCAVQTHEARIFRSHEIVKIDKKPPVAPECKAHKGKLCELFCLTDNV